MAIPKLPHSISAFQRLQTSKPQNRSIDELCSELEQCTGLSAFFYTRVVETHKNQMRHAQFLVQYVKCKEFWNPDEHLSSSYIKCEKIRHSLINKIYEIKSYRLISKAEMVIIMGP
jgi:hypothetical protein